MKELFDALKPGGTEWMLAEAINPDRLPAHVAIIMDGNGRWAGHRSLPRAAGHRAGMDAVRTTVEACSQMGVQALTLYAFSTENWKRPRLEIDLLWRLLCLYLRRELPELMRNDVVISSIGRLDALPGPVRDQIEAAVAATAGNQGLRLTVAVNYSGRTELVDAVNAAIRQASEAGTLNGFQISEEAIAANLYTAHLPDPDLLIRTSGEMRISNFLLWQIAYSELYVTETLWPDFSRADLLRAVLDYQKRDRRFGGLTLPPTGREPERWLSALSATLGATVR